MYRTDLIRSLLSTLFLMILGLIWLWHENFDERLKIWANWVTVTYGCVAGFWIWMQGLRLARLIEDIPTGQIATTAQGYVELFGKATQFEDQKAKTIVGDPVLWYRKEYAERSDDSSSHVFPFNLFYTPIEIEESKTPFNIDDGTGTACILPYGAEIICERKNVQHRDNRRVIEEQILPGDTLYILGDFSTHTLQPEFDQAAYELTRQWEGNPARRRIFDRDGDGKLNEKEWLEMHAAARANIIENELRTNPPSAKHLVFSPVDGRPYVISSVPPEQLAGRYRFHMVLGLFLFLVCGAASFAVLMGLLVS